MNIQTVRDNIKNTIAGKEALLESYKNNSTKFFSESEKMVMIAMIALNITELKKILVDVEQCVAKDVEQSWSDNPDRSCGQFSPDEIYNHIEWK